MADSFSIMADPAQFAAAKRLIDPKRLRQGMFVAVRNTTKKGAKMMAKEVQQVLAVRKAGDIVASSGSDNRRPISFGIINKSDPPSGYIRVSKQMIRLVAFQYKATKKGGVTAIVMRTKPPIRLTHGFVATVRSTQQVANDDAGHKGIFVRSTHLPSKGPNVGKGSLTKRGFAGRFAIEEQFGTSIYSAVNVPEMLARINTNLGEILRTEFTSQVSRFTPIETA